jgi:hypothetical protein
MNRILDNKERAKNLIIGFYVMLGVYVIVLVSDIMEYQLIHGDWATLLQNADANDQRQVLIAILMFIVNVVLIVLFIQWFRRAYHNLHKAGEKNLASSEGWAAGWWFIPIANWFMPYRIMREIWDRTKNYGNADIDDLTGELTDNYDVSADAGSEEVSNDSVSLVNAWWAFWIISNVIANISAQIVMRTSELESIQFASLLGIISDVTGVAAIFFAVRMIKNSQIHQNRFFKAVKNNDKSTFGISKSDDILD